MDEVGICAVQVGLTKKAPVARRRESSSGGEVGRADRSRQTGRDRRTTAGAIAQRDSIGSSRSGRAVGGT